LVPPKKSISAASDTDTEDETSGRCKTPDVKILTKRRSVGYELNSSYSSNHSTLKIKGLQVCGRLSKILLKSDFFGLAGNERSESDQKQGQASNVQASHPPPTLISPIQFENSTLQTNNFSINSMKSNNSTFLMEINQGLILPHTNWILLKVLVERYQSATNTSNSNANIRNFDQTQNFSISGSFETDKASSNFNVMQKNEVLESISEDANDALGNCSLEDKKSKNSINENFYHYVRRDKSLTVRKFTYKSEDGRFEVLK